MKTLKQFKDDFARSYHLTYPKEYNVIPFADFDDAMFNFISNGGRLTKEGSDFIDNLIKSFSIYNEK